jgi:hypothetical protein
MDKKKCCICSSREVRYWNPSTNQYLCWFDFMGTPEGGSVRTSVINEVRRENFIVVGGPPGEGGGRES